ncbi:hypothetical protein [Streptomyces sp. B93]|uniref:hypothetical protein n=1 Tax=Streptomyces sp. B93 TaxID=2824875 RepID=UPI001B366AA5|nr:hypothetical protein [Streptomyces sp. B93]MBQ1093301.1 hypothetical protein [Streptomyces sp. B93]
MPRGRHRHSPPLHRLLPPSAIAGVSLVCALGPWVFTEPGVLRGLAGAAALTAVTGAFIMRRWDIQAGKQVADLTRARASDEWRFEERIAELETDLDESRELRVKLEQRLRSKRAELQGLRNEHAGLLRRYATAETERASALEGRRLLEIEATVPAPALPPAPVAVEPEPVAEEAEPVEETAISGLFSPEGSQLFLRANAALARLAGDAPAREDGSAAAADDGTPGDAVQGDGPEADGPEGDGPQGDGPKGEAPKGEALMDQAVKGVASTADAPTGEVQETDAGKSEAAGPEQSQGEPREREHDTSDNSRTPAAKRTTDTREATAQRADVHEAHARDADAREADAQEAEAKGKPEAADGHQRAAAAPATAPAPAEQRTNAAEPADAQGARPAPPARQPGGHFTVPTAVAVVPASAPVRRPTTEGGFDFFGTKSGGDALEAGVQNEDLADVVGQEALDLHKAEAEAQFKPADEGTRAAGQVIDLTAHDETEHIDVEGLRTAAS